MKKFFLYGLILLTGGIEAFAQSDSYQIVKESYSGYLNPDYLYVIASFDGCRSLDRWQEILDFAKEHHVKITFFISGVDFLSHAQKHQYRYPPNPFKTGISEIGFGGTADDIEKRKAMVLEALANGHDVQCHLNGHFNAKQWKQNEWMLEFKQFNEFCQFLPKPVHHIRFPYLVMNDNVYPALAEYQIYSVTSVLQSGQGQFRRITIEYNHKPYTFLLFPIPHISLDNSSIILMDYNFYLHEKNLHSDIKKSEHDMIQQYLIEADKCYKERRPFFVSHHFHNWNQSAYWNAMKEVLQILPTRYPLCYMTISELYSLLSVPTMADGQVHKEKIVKQPLRRKPKPIKPKQPVLKNELPAEDSVLMP